MIMMMILMNNFDKVQGMYVVVVVVVVIIIIIGSSTRKDPLQGCSEQKRQ